MTTVLDPTSAGPGDEKGLAPRLPSLKGTRGGFRRQWANFDTFVGRIEARMNDEHELSSAAYVGGTFTERNEERRAKWKHFQQQVDWAVVGLGTCWGTAPWTVYDASELEAQGIPTVSVVTDEFEGLARETAAAEGRRGLNMVVVPHFFERLGESAVIKLADDAYPAIVNSLTAAAPQAPGDGSGGVASRAGVDEAWGDGLPIVPPTQQRVDAMLATAGLDPDAHLGFVGPRRGRATAASVAVNAVMAGCAPKHFPIVAAAVSAVADPDFQLDRIGPWTGPAAPMIVVHGPIAKDAGLNGGYDALGGSAAANAAIGRAVRLVLRNIGGNVAGEVTKSPHGQPARAGLCLAENGNDSPWAPAHTEAGLGPEENAVSVYAVTGTAPIFYRAVKESADDLLDVITGCLRYVEGYAKAYHQDGGLPVLLLCPMHARTFARAGMDRAEVRRRLFEAVDFSAVYGEEARLNAPTCIMPGQADTEPGRLPILVSGGPAGFHSTFLPTVVGVPPITKRIARSS